MKIMEYVLFLFGAIVTVSGAVTIAPKTNVPLLMRITKGTANIIGFVMFFSGIVIMIVGAILIEHREK